MTHYANIDTERLERLEAQIIDARDAVAEVNQMLRDYPYAFPIREYPLRNLLDIVGLNVDLLARKARALAAHIEVARGWLH